MSQQQEPQPSQPRTLVGRRTKRILENIFEPLDIIGQHLIGDLWRTLYLTVQDAIALSFLLQILGLIGSIIIGKRFSNFNVCLQENPLGASRYACFITVPSNFLFWVVLTGRIFGRLYADFSSQRKYRKGIK